MYLEQACLLGTGEISTLFHGLLPDVIYFVLTLYKCNEMAIFFFLCTWFISLLQRRFFSVVDTAENKQ